MGGKGTFLFHVTLTVFLLMGLLGYVWKWANGNPPVGVESFLASVIITSLSWTLSSYIASTSARSKAQSAEQDRIDSIAEQASKKLSHQSTHLFAIEQHINEVLLDKYYDDGQLDRTDIVSLVQMIQIVRRNNTGLEEDWCGVASKDLSKTIRDRLIDLEQDFNLSPAERADKIRERLATKDVGGLPISSIPATRVDQKPKVIRYKEVEILSRSDSQLQGIVRVSTRRPTDYLTIPVSISPPLNKLPDLSPLCPSFISRV
ncbi:MAG: hypothetical protein AAFY34_10895 [Pseudomonadota bacterium]